MKKFTIPSAVYDVLKPFALVVLPALSTLYVALGAIWGLPNVKEVVGTITAIDTFLGAALGISTKNFVAGRGIYDGHVSVVRTPESTKYLLELDYDPELILTKKRIVLSVGSPGTSWVPPEEI